jgi:hypothetical protein
MTSKPLGSSLWILDERGEPRLADDLDGWSRWFDQDERRIVRQQRWQRPDGKEVFVSTVFLGIDYGWGHREPVLWETMTFIDDEDVAQYRYSSLRAAIVGHNRAIQAEGGEVFD